MVSNLGTTHTRVKPLSVLYTAAHSGFDLSRVPLGGAAAICDLLTHEWRSTFPFTLRLVSPAVLGQQAPHHKDLVRYSEMRYARFCVEFEKAITDQILTWDPSDTVVLSNDISEGPSFRRLAEKGYRVYTIFHVDVVDYVAALYLRGRIRPARLTAFYEWMDRSPFRRGVPEVLKLIFQKQRDSVLYSRGVIVPSEGMKRVLLECYPQAAPERIHVLPWGCPEESINETAIQTRALALREHYGISEKARVLLTLSRISPEKGQDRFLKALALWERRSDFPKEGVSAVICGEAAYMRGARFQKQLTALARRLKKVHVIFPGYLTGVEKQAHFRLADLYVFPSRHESYGLTLLEAFRASLPALACHHYGAEEILRPGLGELLPPAPESEVPAQLQQALARLTSDRARLKAMGVTAQAFARSRPFSQTARQLADLIVS